MIDTKMKLGEKSESTITPFSLFFLRIIMSYLLSSFWSLFFVYYHFKIFTIDLNLLLLPQGF